MGYAVGFAFPEPGDQDPDQPYGVIMIQCEYDKARHSGQIRSVMEEVARGFRAYTDHYSYAQQQAITLAQSAALFAVRRLAEHTVRYKHDGFKDEQESRIMVYKRREKIFPVKTRPGACGPRPYVEADFRSPSKGVEVKEIILGPACKQPENERAVRLLLDRYGFADCVVVRSRIPYRRV
jgi:hypothetical protein